MKYDSDIFISYAHLDNQPLMANAEGWVSQFHHALEVRVDQLRGKKSTFWRDQKLQGNDFFDDTIVEQLPRTAILVSVFSPRYIKSESCKKELTHFCNASEEEGGIRVLDKSRIFKVLKTPVPLAEHPAQVRDCLGYEFFKIDASGRVRELNQVFGDEAARDFWIKLDDLAQDLSQLLNWLEDGPPGEEEGEAKCVYLAESSFDVSEQRDSIKRDLLAHGIHVLPDGPLPHNSSELEPVVSRNLEQCELSVHVIGGHYGVVPDGAIRSVVQLQNDLAVRREEQGGFSRLVWIPPGLESTDERQARFLDVLRTDPRTHLGADLLETPLEDLNTQIHRILAASPEPPAKRDTRSSGAEPDRVYLVCDARDLSGVKRVADYLFEQGCEVTLPAFEGEEPDVRADHEENLRTADAILIYFGAPNEIWLRGKLRERLKSRGLGRTRPFKATAVLVAPPNSRRESWLRLHDARVIQQKNEFSGALLDPFLSDLRA